MSKDLKVLGVTKKMLRESINENTYWEGSLAPMPKSKAQWMLANPRFEEDDYCAVITTANNQILSFISLVPDYLNLKNNNFKKVYWMVSWWVHPKNENTILGTYTFQEALKLTDNKILIKSYAEHIEPFYKKMPFNIIESRNRYTIFLSLDHSMLLGKFKFLKPFKLFFVALDRVTYYVINFFNKLKFKNTTSKLNYEYINGIDQNTWNFIEPLFKNDLIYKTKDYVNWHLDNNQFTQTPVADKFLYKSIEIGTSNNIYQHNLNIIKNNKIIGFFSYILNYNEFNVKYFLVEKEENYNVCIDALIENFIKKKARYIFTDDTTLAENIKKRFITVFTHKSLKKGLAHNSLELTENEVTLYNRDGHFY
jgi:rRNA-processing protein FCF1